MLKKPLLYFLVPLITFISLILTLIYMVTRSEGMFNLIYDHTHDPPLDSSHLILPDQNIQGIFNSQYPNLGSISIRFNTQNQINTDWLTFSIKEQGSQNWYYQGKYKVDQFQPDQFFPFGFPVINDSQNKTYEFILTSQQGTDDNAVSISGYEPQLRTKYLINKTDLINNRTILLSWITGLWTKLISYPWVVMTLILYPWNIVMYLILITVLIHKKTARLIIHNSKLTFSPQQIIMIAIVGNLIIHAIFYLPMYNYFLIYISLLSYLALLFNKFNYKIFADYSIFILLLIPIFFLTKFNNRGTILTIWIYIWPIIAIIAKFTKRYIPIPSYQAQINTYQINQKNIIYYYNKFSKHIFLLLFVCLLWQGYNTYNLWHNNYQFYQQYYLQNQFQIFIQDYWTLAITIFIANLTLLSIILFLKIDKNLKIILAIFTLILSQNLTQQKFNYTTQPLRHNLKIWSITPKEITLWDQIQIVGRNFGSLPFQGKVFIDNIEHRVISWDPNQIIIQAEPGKTKSGPLVIQTYDGKTIQTQEDLYVYDFFTKQKI